MHVCHQCFQSFPADAGRCPSCGAIPTVPRARFSEALLQELRENQRIILAALEAIPGWESRRRVTTPMPLEMPTEQFEVQPFEQHRIQPIDKLSPPRGDTFRIETSVNDQPKMVAPRDGQRRGLLIANFGLPALGGQAAITPQDAYIDFSESMNRNDSYWLKAGATVSIDSSAPVYVLDDGTNKTVLHCIVSRV